jgi:hypothetical protein
MEVLIPALSRVSYWQYPTTSGVVSSLSLWLHGRFFQVVLCKYLVGYLRPDASAGRAS